MTLPRRKTIQALSCPNCGGTVELHSRGQTVNAVCIQCLSIIDARNPELTVVQQFEARQRHRPLIPLGSRGRLDGHEYEVIGFQAREIVVEDVSYSWSEYLLYNPWRGYRYLAEYQGHWNSVRTMRRLPEGFSGRGMTSVTDRGTTYRLFQRAEARSVYVMGEFPWQVRVGDQVFVEDFISPPRMLSAETSGEETVWSESLYTPGKEIWRAFSLPGAAPASSGIFANQPSPWTGRVQSSWTMFLLLSAVLLFTMLVLALARPGTRVFEETYTFTSPPAEEPAFVTPFFNIRQGGAVEISVRTKVREGWAFFSMALINDDTGTAQDFGLQADEDGESLSRTFSGIPEGRYYLRVEPDMERDRFPRSLRYTVAVRQGVTVWYWGVLGFLVLLIPAVWNTWRAARFEHARWAESDVGWPAMLANAGEES